MNKTVVVARSERLLLRQDQFTDYEFMLALLNEPGWLQRIADHSIQDPNH